MAQKKRFLLRIDPELYEALEKWAADEFRSVNAQIEYLLKQIVKKDNRMIKRKQQAEKSSNDEKTQK